MRRLSQKMGTLTIRFNSWPNPIHGHKGTLMVAMDTNQEKNLENHCSPRKKKEKELAVTNLLIIFA